MLRAYETIDNLCTSKWNTFLTTSQATTQRVWKVQGNLVVRCLRHELSRPWFEKFCLVCTIVMCNFYVGFFLKIYLFIFQRINNLRSVTVGENTRTYRKANKICNRCYTLRKYSFKRKKNVVVVVMYVSCRVWQHARCLPDDVTSYWTGVMQTVVC